MLRRRRNRMGTVRRLRRVTEEIEEYIGCDLLLLVFICFGVTVIIALLFDIGWPAQASLIVLSLVSIWKFTAPGR